MNKLVIPLLVMFVVACQSNGTPVPEAITEQPANNVENETSAPQEPGYQYPTMRFVISGPEEVVFDWTTDKCEPENIPDIAARAFRDANGQVQLTIGHYVGYRMIGPNLNNLKSDCSAPINQSDYDPNPSMFNDAEWIGALYTPDGEKVYAVVHNEYRGHMHGSERPGQCPSGDYLTCLDTSLTMMISTDGGVSYRDISEAPNHLIATLPYTFDDQGVPSGLRQPSIIHAKDGYFYIFANVSDYPTEEQWACLMRTDNLDDPSSWRYWDGKGFNGQFINPYTTTVDENTPTCARPSDPDLGAGLVESITYNTVLERYVAVGVSFNPYATQPTWGIYYTTSSDLLEWSKRQLLLEVPNVASVTNPDTDLTYAYPTLIDPDSPSINFDTTDGNAYLYMTRANFGGGSLDRDLVRYPITLEPITYDIPDWDFDTDGDVEGWLYENQIENFNVTGGVLSMQTTGLDPIMNSPVIEFPASEYAQISITMKVSPGEPTSGQMFFVTDLDKRLDETKSMVFQVINDGEFHTYILDMSSVSGWSGMIQQFRFDPITEGERTIEIDRIVVSP